MRLVSCYIENFGKLKDLTLEFNEDLNIICQKNGWGKSTLADFIKVMLYGFREEKSRDELKNERKRYRPWQGGVYGGRLEFEAEGEHFVLTRTFGMKEKEDRFSLRKKTTNLECEDYSANLGEELFSLDCGSFCRTVFLSQNDCETAATDAINAKIGNLAEDTDDINNYESVNKRFENLLNQMSPVRKTGALYKMKDEISRLEESVRNGYGVDQAISEISARRHEKLSEQQKLKEEQTALMARQRQISAFKDIQVKREKYKALCQEYEERKEKVERERKYFPGRVPDTKELEDLIAESVNLPAAQESARIYRLSEEEMDRGRQLERLFKAHYPDQDELREREKQLNELQNLRVAVAGNQLDREEAKRLDGYNSRFPQGIPEVYELEEVIADWNRCVEKKSMLSQKKINYGTLQGIAQVGLDRMKDTENSGDKISIWGVALLLVGVMLSFAGFLFMKTDMGTLKPSPVTGGIVIFLGILSIAVGIWGIIGKVSRHRRDSDGFSEGIQGNEGLERMQREILEDEAFIERTCEQTKRFMENQGISCEREEDILDSLYGFKAEVRDYITLSRRQGDARIEELESRRKDMRDSLYHFLNAYYPEISPEETEYAAKLSELKEMVREYVTLKKKGENFLKAQKVRRQLLSGLCDFMESLSMKAEEDLQSQLIGIQSHLQSLNGSLKELANIERRKSAFEDAEDMDEILKALPTQDTESLKSVNQRLEEIADRLEKIYGYLSDYNRQLEGLREEGDRVAEDAEALAALKEEYQKDREKYEMLKKTQELLKQAKISFTAKYTEPLRNSLGKYYELLTGESAQHIFVDANTSVTVDEQGMQRDPKFLSAGYRDLIGVCMRMALIDAMYQGQKPFVIFDDPFANLDKSKLAGAMELLKRIGKEYQVLYFTCHESRTI